MPQTELEALIFQMDVNLSKMNKKLDKMTADTKKTSSQIQLQLDKAGGSISKNFTGAIEGAASQVPILGDALISLGGPALAATAAVAVLGVGLHKAREAMDWAAETTDLADHIGITTEALQEYNFIADEFGVNVSDMQTGLQALNASLGAIQTGVGSAKIEKAFAAIGISKDQLASMNDATDLMPLLADRISDLGTKAERVQIAKKLGIETLLPILEQGSDGIAVMTQRANDLGLVIDGKTVSSLDNLQRQAEIASQRIDVQLKKAFINLAPAITGATTAIADFTQWLAKPAPTNRGSMGEYLLNLAINPQQVIRDAVMSGEYKKLANANGGSDQGFNSKKRGRLDLPSGSAEGDKPTTPTKAQATGAIQLIEALMAEDARLAKQYEDDKKKLAAGLKQREITQAQYDAALAELTREYKNKQSGTFVTRKDYTQDQEDRYGKIEKDTLGTQKDRDINIIDPMMKLPQVVNPAREALEGLRSVSRDIAYDLGEALAYGDDLGDAVSHSFRRIAAEWITGGLDDIFAALLGKSGSSSGGLLGSILNGIGGGITGARAGGGMVSGAGSYLVGEHGPEVFTPGLNGSIINNNALRALQGARAAGSQAIRVQVEASPYFDVRVTQIAQPMSERAAQVGVYGGAQLARTQAAKQQRSEMY
ncbi:hypothetical protein [Asticcacaulis sp.]|uniref:hypothetical protein n=1 Tax=Asticcacaulis sp. TaxID=1872648 RepID=UPI003F7B4A48